MNSNFLNIQKQQPLDMNSYFPNLPTEFPPYYICQLSSRNNMNDRIDNRREAFVRDSNQVTKGDNLGYQISPSSTWRYEQGPKEAYNEFSTQEVMTPDFVNLGGRGDLFYGYARNVDVESDLKRINFMDDKCFDNKYKIDPLSPTTSLFRHKDIIVKDYLKVQDNTYRDHDAKPLGCVDPKSQLTNSEVTGFYDNNYNNYFKVGPGFDNRPGECYPEENPFNNMTKRKMIFTRNRFNHKPEKYM
jgi:hypothetical protein